MMKKLDRKPQNDPVMEVEVTEYRNVYLPVDESASIVKEEVHIGMQLDQVFESINTILTVSEIDTIDEEINSEDIIHILYTYLRHDI